MQRTAWPGRARILALVTLAALFLLPPAAPAKRGSDGVGDPYFPKAGNGGYDVAHYGLRLHYNPATNHLAAVTRISATASERLSRFDLDFRGPAISRLTVNGSRAVFRRSGQELIVTPSSPLPDGSSLRVTVAYAGHPHPIMDPDGSIDGWVRTADGAFVVDEPQGSPTWFPCNDHPIDKATYRFRVTVPATHVAVANGLLERETQHGDRRTFVWNEGQPMASYLATVTTGIFNVQQGTAADVPSYVAVDPSQSVPWSQVSAKLPTILGFFEATFGEYPFDATGAIVDDTPVGYSLETQTRPAFPSAPGQFTLAHELAHQWFGDSVSVATWKQIWLNEGFATFAEWLWDEHIGGPTTHQRFEDLYTHHGANDDTFWNPPPGDPGSAALIFDQTIYQRGGMTLAALRDRLGDDTFFSILRRWATRYRFGNANTRDLIGLAEARSGRRLGKFFNDWLYEPGKPPGY